MLLTPIARFGRGLATLARAESAPYLLTILLAALAWTLSQLSTMVLQSPVLEYDLRVTRQGDRHYLNCVLSNITTNRVYQNLVLEFRAAGQERGEFSRTVLRPRPPYAWKASKGVEKRKGWARFLVPAMHPGSQVMLEAVYQGNRTPQFFLLAHYYFRQPGGKQETWAPEEPVRLMASSLRTWLARHATELMLGLALLWALLILVHIYSLGAQGKKPGERGEKLNQKRNER